MPEIETEYSQAEKVTLAAWRLEERGLLSFSLEMLVVEAWKEFPGTFGLHGYAEHCPDSNRVNCVVVGKKGLVRRGVFVKEGQKLYTLSRDGRAQARRLICRAIDNAGEHGSKEYRRHGV